MVLRSIREFFVCNAQPSSLKIYQDFMRERVDESGDANRETGEKRPHKILVRDALRQKHAKRLASATNVSIAK